VRIGAIYTHVAVNQYYRSRGPVNALAHEGHEVVTYPAIAEQIDVGALLSCDVVQMYRSCDPYLYELAKGLQARGVAVTYDQDDDWSSVKAKKGEAKFKYLGGLKGQQLVASSLRLARRADLMTTTSEGLAERYRVGGVERIEVIENYLVMPPVPAPRRDRGEVRIGWVAGGEHKLERDQLQLRETLTQILQTHPNVTIATIGTSLEIADPRYSNQIGESFLTLLERLSTFDIGIAPLVDTTFNRARSNVKLKEYAAAGVPWLASPVGSYAPLGEAQGGLLVADDGWFEALDALVRNPAERERLAANARTWASEQTINLHTDRWERAFTRAVEHARESRAKVARRR
jgi:glycosyltransferase involved in cell wall biosynthesis